MPVSKEEVLRRNPGLKNQAELVARLEAANRRKTLVHRVPRAEAILSKTDLADVSDIFLTLLRRVNHFKSVTICFVNNLAELKTNERQLLSFEPTRNNTYPWDSLNNGRVWLANQLAELFQEQPSAVAFQITETGVSGIFDMSKKIQRTRKVTKEDLDQHSMLIDASIEKLREQHRDKILYEARVQSFTDTKVKAKLDELQTRLEEKKKTMLAKQVLVLGSEIPSDTFCMTAEFTPQRADQFGTAREVSRA